MGMKRRRLALSCVDCRRRKVKCGREMPSCVRCVRGGHGDSCSYVQYDDKSQPGLPTPTDESPEDKRDGSPGAQSQSWTEEADQWHRTSAAASNPGVNGNPVKRRTTQKAVEQLQERVFELEACVKAAGSRPVSSEKFSGMYHPAGTGASQHRDALEDFERSLLRGRSFRTQYFGPSHAASLLLQFEELSACTKDILKRTPYFEKVKDDLKGMRKINRLASDADEERDFQAFAAMLPSKIRADALFKQYSNTFETSYRVMHIPTFTKQYDQFWADSSESNIHFVVQLLLVCAAVNCVVPGETNGFVGRSSVTRETAIRWIEASETWLNNQSQKHTTLEYYQIHVLLLIAKRMTCYKIKREWTAAGTLLHRAMAAGFHREPTFLSTNISPFDQEMRRRLWFTILELELQASCDRGMRASITADDWDCLPPLNIHDEDFNITTQTMPSPLPLTTFTHTSFLCSAVNSLPLRLEILNAVNAVSTTITLASVMNYDERLRALLDSLPTYLSNPSKPITFPTALSKLLLHEFLLLLHQPFATSSLSQSRYFYSRCARRDSALTVLRIYTSSTLPLPDRLLLANSRDDALRACLSTCHDIVISSDPASTFPSSIPDMTHDRNLSVSYINDTVTLFGTRVKSLGQGFHSYWITSSALALVSTKVHPDQPPDTYIQEAADRVRILHDEIMALQKPGYNGHVFMGKLHAHAVKHGLQPPPVGEPQSENQEVTNNNGGNVEGSFVIDGFTPPDPFNQSIFDFDNFDIWNMGLGIGDAGFTGVED